MLGLNSVNTSLCVDCPVEINKIIVLYSGSFRQVYRVTNEDSISITVV